MDELDRKHPFDFSDLFYSILYGENAEGRGIFDGDRLSMHGEPRVTTSFENISGSDLEQMSDDELNVLEFGVVGLDAGGVVSRYNSTESALAGLRPETVLGTDFFDEIAQCMNNFLVAQRFEDEAEIDDVIPYVLTLRMRPTPVRLRLLKGKNISLRYILIQR